MKFAAVFALSLSTAAAALATGTPAAAPAQPAKPAAAAPAKPAAAPAAPKPEELWFIAKAADGAIGYNAKSIKPNPQLSTVTMTSLIYLKTAAKSKSGASYNYILSEDTLDCIGPQFKPGARVVLDAQGKLLDGGDAAGTTWLPIQGNPPLNALRGVACSGASFKNMQQATNFAAAVKMMREMK
jgi:hypothetical protein